MRRRRRRRFGIGLLWLLAGAAAAAAAQKTIECPDGEKRLEIEIEQLRIEYQGHAFTSTLGSLGFLVQECLETPQIAREGPLHGIGGQGEWRAPKAQGWVWQWMKRS